MAISLKTTDLCLKQDKTINCFGQFYYNCSTQYCANNKLACDDFRILGKHMNTVKSERKSKIVKSLIKSIKKCRQDHLWEPDDICLNSFNCAKIEPKKNNHFYSKFTICRCNSKLSHQCGYYCTEDEEACNRLKNSNNEIIKIPSCSNF